MIVQKVQDIVRDERGSIVEVVSGEEWRQLNLVTSRRGSLRGGHYHKKGREFFYVLDGQLDVKTISVTTKETQRRIFRQGECFTVLPLEQHYMKYLADSTIVILYSRPFTRGAPDVFEEQDLPPLKEAFSEDS